MRVRGKIRRKWCSQGQPQNSFEAVPVEPWNFQSRKRRKSCKSNKIMCGERQVYTALPTCCFIQRPVSGSCLTCWVAEEGGHLGDKGWSSAGITTQNSILLMMYDGFLPIPWLKINAGLWHMALLCLRHGSRQGQGKPMALYKMGTQLWESHAHYGRLSRSGNFSKLESSVVRTERVFVTHLNDSAIEISG